jgi:hypothetical protein
MPIVRQADFTGGEVDPRLYGKTTHPKYPTFVRKMSNFFAVPQGAALNRPGTIFVGLARDQTAAPRIIRFDWPSQNYLLEVSAGNIRVWANGVFVVDVPALDISAGAVDRLKYSQNEDELVLTYGGQGADPDPMVPLVLRRVSHAVWTLGMVQFVPTLIFVDVIYLSDANGNLTSSPVAVPDAEHQAQPWNWAFTLTVRDSTGRVFETGIAMRLTDVPVYQNAARTVTLPVAYDPVFTYAAGHPVVYLGQLWTSLQAGNVGNTPGDAASAAWWVNGIAVYPDAPVYFNLKNVVTNALTTSPGYQILAVNVYRGKHGVFGFLGAFEIKEPGVAVFADVGDTPDYAQAPPAGTDPFAIYDATGTLTGHDYPACVTHYQQRRVFARQPSHLGRLQASKPGQLGNYDVTDIVQDSDALNFDLASQAMEDIRSLISARALIVLTSTGATVVRGSGSQRGGSTAITPSSIDATKQGTRGASWVDPLVVDNTVLYPGSKGAAIHAASYDPFYEVLSNLGSDLGLVAQHLLRGHTIVDMTFQESPNSLVWLVRDDGLLLGLTFLPAQQPDNAIHGWHQHPTNGTVQRVCVVQEGLDDVLYLVTQRAGAFLLERMATRSVDDVRLGVFLDAARTFDGRNTGLTTMAFVSDAGTYDGGEEGTITASAAAFVGDSDVGDMIVFDPNGATDGPFSLTVLAYTDATHVRAILNTPLPPGFQIATTGWGWARDTVTGLAHLEGRDVMALADGATQGPFTVAGGAITLSQPAVIATVGLSYTSDMELLDIMPDQVRTNVKGILKVTLEVVASRGVLAGEDETALKPWRTRDAPDAFGNPPLVTRQIDVGVPSTWNKGGRAFIRQVEPLPLTITAAIRDLEIGGRG